MMSSSGQKDAAVEPEKMLTADLRQHVERCERLLRHPQLLDRLPDKGDGIRQRLTLFSNELQRRANEVAAHDSASVEQQQQQQQQQHNANDNNTNSGAKELLVADSDAAWLHELETKYMHHRVSTEDTVRRMYEGSLSEKEIQRILDDVPPKYFMTFAETREMEKNFAKAAREAELRKLRQNAMMASPSLPNKEQ